MFHKSVFSKIWFQSFFSKLGFSKIGIPAFMSLTGIQIGRCSHKLVSSSSKTISRHCQLRLTSRWFDLALLLSVSTEPLRNRRLCELALHSHGQVNANSLHVRCCTIRILDFYPLDPNSIFQKTCFFPK